VARGAAHLHCLTGLALVSPVVLEPSGNYGPGSDGDLRSDLLRGFLLGPINGARHPLPPLARVLDKPGIVTTAVGRPEVPGTPIADTFEVIGVTEALCTLAQDIGGS
jgi:hypothetical protein